MVYISDGSFATKKLHMVRQSDTTKGDKTERNRMSDRKVPADKVELARNNIECQLNKIVQQTATHPGILAKNLTVLKKVLENITLIEDEMSIDVDVDVLTPLLKLITLSLPPERDNLIIEFCTFAWRALTLRCFAPTSGCFSVTSRRCSLTPSVPTSRRLGQRKSMFEMLAEYEPDDTIRAIMQNNDNLGHEIFNNIAFMRLDRRGQKEIDTIFKTHGHHIFASMLTTVNSLKRVKKAHPSSETVSFTNRKYVSSQKQLNAGGSMTKADTEKWTDIMLNLFSDNKKLDLVVLLLVDEKEILTCFQDLQRNGQIDNEISNMMWDTIEGVLIPKYQRVYHGAYGGIKAEKSTDSQIHIGQMESHEGTCIDAACTDDVCTPINNEHKGVQRCGGDQEPRTETHENLHDLESRNSTLHNKLVITRNTHSDANHDQESYPEWEVHDFLGSQGRNQCTASVQFVLELLDQGSKKRYCETPELIEKLAIAMENLAFRDRLALYKDFNSSKCRILLLSIILYVNYLVCQDALRYFEYPHLPEAIRDSFKFFDLPPLPCSKLLSDVPEPRKYLSTFDVQERTFEKILLISRHCLTILADIALAELAALEGPSGTPSSISTQMICNVLNIVFSSMVSTLALVFFGKDIPSSRETIKSACEEIIISLMRHVGDGEISKRCLIKLADESCSTHIQYFPLLYLLLECTVDCSCRPDMNCVYMQFKSKYHVSLLGVEREPDRSKEAEFGTLDLYGHIIDVPLVDVSVNDYRYLYVETKVPVVFILDECDGTTSASKFGYTTNSTREQSVHVDQFEK